MLHALSCQIFLQELAGKPQPGPVRVLSVDDDPINQLVIQNLLVPEGFKVGAWAVRVYVGA